MLFTVFTPTYNRAYILSNLYRSLQCQTCQDFEWLIIDDGSSDNTEGLIHKWIDEDNWFQIRYYKQANGGKCRAINKALDLAQGKLFFVVDSDDYLAQDALEKVALWESTIKDKESYCGVSGNLGTDEMTTPNHLFDTEFYDGTLLDRYKEVDGERAFIFYTVVHRRYKYPEFDDEKFMTEAITYNRMAHDGYKMRFFNDIICIYEYQEDGLTRNSSDLFLDNPRGYGLWLREKAEYSSCGFIDKLRMWYTFYCDECESRPDKRLPLKKCADCIGAPVIFISISRVIHRARGLFKRHEH